MDQDPVPTPSPSADGKSGIFTKLNGAIAGVTGLVIALGGLAATWDKIFPDDKGQAEASTPAQLTNAEAVPADETAGAGADEAEPEPGDPILYTGEKVDGGKVVKLEWNDNGWTLTEGDDTYAYDDILSPDATKVMAVSNGSYLRWPIAGGEVDESDDKVKWRTYAKVVAVEEPAAN